MFVHGSVGDQFSRVEIGQPGKNDRFVTADDNPDVSRLYDGLAG